MPGSSPRAAVADGSGLVHTGVAPDIAGGSGLVYAGVYADAAVTCGAGLIHTGVAPNVAGNSRLVYARVYAHSAVTCGPGLVYTGVNPDASLTSRTIPDANGPVLAMETRWADEEKTRGNCHPTVLCCKIANIVCHLDLLTDLIIAPGPC